MTLNAFLAIKYQVGPCCHGAITATLEAVDSRHIFAGSLHTLLSVLSVLAIFAKWPLANISMHGVRNLLSRQCVNNTQSINIVSHKQHKLNYSTNVWTVLKARSPSWIYLILWCAGPYLMQSHQAIKSHYKGLLIHSHFRHLKFLKRSPSFVLADWTEAIDFFSLHLWQIRYTSLYSIRTRGGINGKIWSEPEGNPKGSGLILPYILTWVLIRTLSHS